MSKKNIIAIKAIVIVVFFILVLGWAGRSDYNDAIITEMKNNGAYWELSEAHPRATDTELIAIYKGENK